MRWIVLALALLISGSASAQVGQSVWLPITNPTAGGGGGGSCASAANTEVQTWGTNVDGQGGAVSPTQCGNVDTLVTSLKTAVGTPLSSKVSRLWLATSADTTAGDIAAQFKVDVIHGDLLDFTTANIASRLDHLTGYTPNGTSEYIKTTFTPSSSDTGVFGLNSAAMGVYILSTGNTDHGVVLSAFDGTNADQIYPFTAGNYLLAWSNDTAGNDITIGTGPTTFRGFNWGYRISGGGGGHGARLYNTGTPTTTEAGQAVAALPTVVFYINAQNNNGTAANFSNVSTGAVILGNGNSIYDTQVDAVAAALNVYMTSVGAFHW